MAYDKFNKLPPSLDVTHGDGEESHGFLRPVDRQEVQQRHDVVAIGSLSVRAFPPGNPALEQFLDREIEGTNLGGDRWRAVINQDRWQQRRIDARRRHGRDLTRPTNTVGEYKFFLSR